MFILDTSLSYLSIADPSLDNYQWNSDGGVGLRLMPL